MPHHERVHAEEMAKHLLCRVGWHKWVRHVNDSHQAYRTCRRCNKHDDNEGAVMPIDWH